MNVKKLLQAALLGALMGSFPGCQSWQGAPFPMQNATRVPPPGTGTYQLPSGYYNNSTSALPAAQNIQTAATEPGLRPATGSFPSTNLPATNLARASMSAAATGSTTNGINPLASSASPVAASASYAAPPASPAPVVQAAHAQSAAGNAAAQFTAPPSAATGPGAGGSTAGANQAAASDAPSLQWQQFSGE